MPMLRAARWLLCLLILLGVPGSLWAEAPAPRPAAAPAVAQRHMIAAANPLAAQAGLDMLRRGGSAVDAAIATQLVLTLVEPQSSGIGGGAFLLYFHARDGRVTAYDGRETAPRAARPDRFLYPSGKPMTRKDAVLGGRSVGVPGVPALLWRAHRDYGKLPWKDLFEPAIRLATDGFTVSPRLHQLIVEDPWLASIPGAKAYFFPDGKPLPVGTILKNPDLAQTLRLLSAGDPAKSFYRGPVAKAIITAVRRAPVRQGDITPQDLTAYAAKKREALCVPYRDWRVCGMPPPSSGGIAVAQTLGILTHFVLATVPPGSTDEVHLVTEAERLAFADRNLYVGDPDFVDVPVRGLLDPAYLAGRARLISTDRAMDKAVAGDPPPVKHALRRLPGWPDEAPSTSHLSVVDDAGDAVSMTTSVEGPFGSHLMAGGFILNNQLTDFSLVPVGEGGGLVANAVSGGKRPMSAMAPTFVFGKDGKLLLAVGSPGGPRIIGYVVQTLLGALDRGLPVQQAVDQPHFAAVSELLDLEADSPLAVIAPALRAKGHKVEVVPLTSGLYAVARTPDGLAGGVDRRREGVALGD